MLEELQWPELQERRQQASLTFFYKTHNNLVTVDKNRYLSAAGGNRSTRSHPFQYHRPNAYTDGLKFSFFPRTISTWNGVTTKAASAETVDGFSPKYDLGLGRDACPWGLLVNSFNWGGFVKDLYCYLFLFLFSLSLSLCLSLYVPHPHLPSWLDMTECSIGRKKEKYRCK